MTTDLPRWLDFMLVDELPDAPKNPKFHDPSIGQSLARFGYVEAIALDERTGRLVAGHGRKAELLATHAAGEPPPEGIVVGEDGRWLAPVQRGWASGDDGEAAAYVVASNQTSIAGGWIEGELEAMTADLAALDVSLDGLGLDLDALIHVGEHDRGLPEDEDPLPIPADPITQPGDVWDLGPHRLICGDSTDPTTFGVLMGGGLAHCIWTDPPYGVSYVGKTADAMTIENDGPKGLRAFLASAWTACVGSVEPGSPWYVASPAGPLGIEFRLSLQDAGWRIHQDLVWIKDVFVLGHSDYHYRHEPILYGWTPGEGRSGRGNHDGTRWRGDHARDSVFEIPRPKRSSEHPTMKPVELIEAQMVNSSRPGDVVLDPFGGSGSTLIAAQNLGRVARLVELDPGYCDVILDRWERHSGTTPVKGN